ncbi:hypothetical protein GZ77_16685 [Endozoicomonas montiporae]|uniref:Uncharacterized protein n=2 Tax=Endozoicomonas montiporae TaxID=1027273 RepID=A0A081N614_9GAMM|nr:hypothetical protein [Endozoicomonas montiporae]AMO57194.1 hypothetical protein EZMO1_3189 [Endozoicomonas montiporae CL-33]KEQ13887.1 hypothetical protein GZ77_16685 [Endozoicomonas montiporae]
MLTQSDCASGGCLSVDEARDLSYAFSKINMSWSEFIYHHWDNAALAALGFIGYNGFMYHQELRSAFKVAKYAAVRVIVKRELGDIEGWYIKRKPIETFGKKITNYKVDGVFKKNSHDLSVLASSLKNSGAWVIAGYALKTLSDSMLGDKGAYYYFLRKYTGQDVFLDNYSYCGSFLYGFHQAQANSEVSFGYPAKEYFKISLDMALFNHLILAFVNSTALVKLQKAETTFDNTLFTGAEKKNLAKVTPTCTLYDQTCGQTMTKLSEMKHCFLLSFEAEDAFGNAVAYMNFCPGSAPDSAVLQLSSDSTWYQISKDQIDWLVRRLVDILNAYRLNLYKTIKLDSIPPEPS